MSSDDLVLEMKIQASPETVFDYLVDPEKLLRWQAEAAEFELAVGAAYRLTIFGETIAAGEVVSFDRPSSLVYTWGWEGNGAIPPGSTTVEYTLEKDGDFTLVRVSHRGLPNAASVAQHDDGWTHYLERLSVIAAGGDPGPDPWAGRPAESSEA